MPRIAALGLLTFLAVVVGQHVLEPALSPREHTISEYANASAGGLMTAGFLAWAVSLAATGASVRAVLGRPGRWLWVLLGVAAVGMVVTAAFKTQTSAGVLPAGTARSLSGRLHDWGSGATLLALFGAGLAAARGQGLPSRPRRVIAALVATALVIHLGLLVLGDPAPGWRQRALLVVAVAWQAVLVRELHRASGPASRAR